MTRAHRASIAKRCVAGKLLMNPRIPGLDIGRQASVSESLCLSGLAELSALLRSRKVSARELMTEHWRRIRVINPTLNALVSLASESRCMEMAAEADDHLARGSPVGPLHGLPAGIKDTEPAVGFPFTRGSPIFRQTYPSEDSLVVERIRHAGALIIGKTNVPEFGMGSHTYNGVFGTTLNPYDLRKSAGGSSGGAAAALATGLIAVANGSDLGGSLRNPANFNNIVGLRPSVGLVPTTPNQQPFGNLGVKGPMGRTVSDVAYLLAVMAGPDACDPLCYPCDPTRFAMPLEREWSGVRVAWSPDLGGLPVERAVRHVMEAQRRLLEAMGCIVEEACPDLSGAEEAFLTLRLWSTHHQLGGLLKLHRNAMKPEAVWEIEAGARVTSIELARAMATQVSIAERMRQFHERYAFLVCPVNQVVPFDADIPWPRSIEGCDMEHYIAWMRSAYFISATGCPAISVPAGFTEAGLPVGVQLVGRNRADFELLQFAHAVEQANRVGKIRPTSGLWASLNPLTGENLGTSG